MLDTKGYSWYVLQCKWIKSCRFSFLTFHLLAKLCKFATSQGYHLIRRFVFTKLQKVHLIKKHKDAYHLTKAWNITASQDKRLKRRKCLSCSLFTARLRWVSPLYMLLKETPLKHLTQVCINMRRRRHQRVHNAFMQGEIDECYSGVCSNKQGGIRLGVAVDPERLWEAVDRKIPSFSPPESAQSGLSKKMTTATQK